MVTGDRTLSQLELLLKACLTEPSDAMNRASLADCLLENGLHDINKVRLLSVPEGRWCKPGMIMMPGMFAYSANRAVLKKHKIKWPHKSNGKPNIGLLVDVGNQTWLHDIEAKRCRVCNSGRNPMMLADVDELFYASNHATDELRERVRRRPFGEPFSWLFKTPDVRPEWMWLCVKCYRLDDVLAQLAGA